MVNEPNAENEQEQRPEVAFDHPHLAKRAVNMARLLFSVAKVVWLLLSLAVLVFTLVYSDGKYKTDATEAETIVMMFLSFPSGWLVVLLLVGVVGGWRHLLGNEFPELPFILLSWLLWTAIGYFQWFLLVPWCGRRLKVWRQRRTDHAA